MPSQSRTATAPAFGFGSRLCRLSASRTCSSCGARVCWQHIRQRCSNGAPTRYGVTQHLTAPHAEELRDAGGFTLANLRAVRQDRGDRSETLIVVTLTYRAEDDETKRLKVYPSGLLAPQDEAAWLPDAALSAWPDRVNLDHIAGWATPQECAARIASAILKATNAKRRA